MSEENMKETMQETSNSEQDDMMNGSVPRWYVVHTYSGYENKVKANIMKTIENRHLEDQILEVRVPMQEVMEMKNGVEKAVSKKLFPGYVLLNMLMNEDTWYVVRNTRGVTGFVGPGSKPVPLTEEEMEFLHCVDDTVHVDFGVDDWVMITEGVNAKKIAQVQSIDLRKKTVTVIIDLLGGVPMELSLREVKKIEE